MNIHIKHAQKFFTAMLIDDPKVIGTDRLVWYTLCSFAQWKYKDGKPVSASNVFPSYPAIAERAGLARSTVIKSVKLLQELGYVEIIENGGGRRNNSYRLNPHPHEDNRSDRSEESNKNKNKNENAARPKKTADDYLTPAERIDKHKRELEEERKDPVKRLELFQSMLDYHTRKGWNNENTEQIRKSIEKAKAEIQERELKQKAEEEIQEAKRKALEQLAEWAKDHSGKT